MSWYHYGDDDDEDWDEEEEGTSQEEALIFLKGPQYAVSKRGEIGATWWGKQWVEAMQQIGDTRLDRGKSYARNGQVRDLSIGHGAASAKVQGSRRRPYSSSFRLKVFTADQWARALDALAAQAIYSAKLLAGEMPSDIEALFQQIGMSLFPRSRVDFTFSCSCPDWGDPCKHSAAIYYLVAEQLDQDPFMLFHLRGLTREQVLKGLRQRRGVEEATPERTAPEIAPPLDADLARFWTLRAAMPTLSQPETPSRSPVLARLGLPPGGSNLAWGELYRGVSEMALRWLDAGDGGMVEDPTSLPKSAPVSKSPEISLNDLADLVFAFRPFDLSAIPLLKDQQARLEQVLVDCYDPFEELGAMEAYLTDALHCPFKAWWRDPDEPGYQEEVVVLGVDEAHERRGVLLRVRRGKKTRRIEADQVWPLEEKGVNATVLGDYRAWYPDDLGDEDYDVW